jgi:hypothetical protein
VVAIDLRDRVKTDSDRIAILSKNWGVEIRKLSISASSVPAKEDIYMVLNQVYIWYLSRFTGYYINTKVKPLKNRSKLLTLVGIYFIIDCSLGIN